MTGFPEQKQRMQDDLPVFYAIHLRDLKHFPASVAHSSKMDKNIYSGRDLSADRRKRKLHPHQHHGLQSA